MEVRINKEVRNYQESLFFGLSLRQLLFALLAVAVAVGVYFGLRPVLGNGEIGWVCVLAAFPFALGGFFQYNGMTLERFLLAYIRSEFLFPRRLVFRSDNIYAKALENSTTKKDLRFRNLYRTSSPSAASGRMGSFNLAASILKHCVLATSTTPSPRKRIRQPCFSAIPSC